jgi:hypothetical protein
MVGRSWSTRHMHGRTDFLCCRSALANYGDVIRRNLLCTSRKVWEGHGVQTEVVCDTASRVPDSRCQLHQYSVGSIAEPRLMDTWLVFPMSPISIVAALKHSGRMDGLLYP